MVVSYQHKRTISCSNKSTFLQRDHHLLNTLQEDKRSDSFVNVILVKKMSEIPKIKYMV